MNPNDVVASFIADNDQQAVAKLAQYRRDHPGQEYNAEQVTELDTERPAATQQSPLQQARAWNGMPMWEIYARNNGHVVHTFVEQTQASAWVFARRWIEENSSVDPSMFSCRPKMED
jgi:hypothetical protein